MTPKPRKSRNARRTPHKTVKRDPLDNIIDAVACALDLKIDKAWKPAIRAHLRVTLRHGASVTAFVLPDETEPAPVFKS